MNILVYHYLEGLASKAGYSLFAARLGVTTATIYRELKRGETAGEDGAPVLEMDLAQPQNAQFLMPWNAPAACKPFQNVDFTAMECRFLQGSIQVKAACASAGRIPRI